MELAQDHVHWSTFVFVVQNVSGDDMTSKTETEQNFGELSACCQWELSKAETKSNK